MAVTVGSDLGFLQVGRELELEDTQNGKKRPASIDRVEVVVDPTSHVPQLVVTLRYADVSVTSDPAVLPLPIVETAPPAKAPSSDDLAAVEHVSASMKGFLARSADRIGPAMGRFVSQARTMFEILRSRRANRLDEAAAARRTTAPPPGGGLHATGRRVVRGEPGAPSGEGEATPSKLPMTGRRAVIAGGVVVAAILGALAVKKLHHEPPPQEAATTPPAAASASTPSPAVAPVASATALAPTPPEPPAAPVAAPAPKVLGDADDSIPSSKGGHKKAAVLRVTPFANGPVHHPNVLHLKMDGPIEAIEGAQQPTGFAIKIPGRKSLEAAAPLAARDSRIAAIKVSNDQAGAELTVAFRDGVPNYRVSARGDTLVIALAPAGALDKTAAIKEDGASRLPGREHRSPPPHHLR
jgi:hypothetical protein